MTANPGSGLTGVARKSSFAILLAAALCAALSGCGRRAELDTPYQAAVDARREAQRNNQPLPPEPVAPPVDKPFILDRLL